MCRPISWLQKLCTVNPALQEDSTEASGLLSSRGYFAIISDQDAGCQHLPVVPPYSGVLPRDHFSSRSGLREGMTTDDAYFSILFFLFFTIILITRSNLSYLFNSYATGCWMIIICD